MGYSITPTWVPGTGPIKGSVPVKKIIFMDGIQEEIPVIQEEDSSWEVFSSEGSSDFSESCEESSDESSGDEVLRHRFRKRAAIP